MQPASPDPSAVTHGRKSTFDAALRRHDAGQDDTQPSHDLLKRHLTYPIPGVYALDRELFVYLRVTPGTPKPSVHSKNAERRRALDLGYTKSNYLVVPTEHEQR